MALTLNDLTLNSAGIYKGGAREVFSPDVVEDKTNELVEGDKLVIRFYKVPKVGEETLIGTIESEILGDPGEGKKWCWFSRDWCEPGDSKEGYEEKVAAAEEAAIAAKVVAEDAEAIKP